MNDQSAQFRKIEMFVSTAQVEKLIQMANGDESRVPELIRQAITDFLAISNILNASDQRLMLQNPDGSLKRLHRRADIDF